MGREQAEMAIFITLENPTQPMKDEAKVAGHFHHAQMARNYDKIQIVTIQEILEQNKRLDIPMSIEVLKTAQRDVQIDQMDLGL
jgi:site-specific DNA-methyltransferase (adenine-specific)